MHLVVAGDRFGPVKGGERLIIIVNQTHARGQTDPGVTSPDIIGRHVLSLAIEIDSFRGIPNVALAGTFEHQHTEDITIVRGDLPSPAKQLQSPLEVEMFGLDFGRLEIGVDRLRVLGPVEMFGSQHMINVSKPFGGTLMNFALLGVEQRQINTLSYHGVREQIVLPFPAHQLTIKQPGAIISRIADQVTQNIERKTLAMLLASVSSNGPRSMVIKDAPPAAVRHNWSRGSPSMREVITNTVGQSPTTAAMDAR